LYHILDDVWHRSVRTLYIPWGSILAHRPSGGSYVSRGLTSREPGNAHVDLDESSVFVTPIDNESCEALVVLAIEHIEEHTYKTEPFEWNRGGSAQ
jgi:hypothetical protein